MKHLVSDMLNVFPKEVKVIGETESKILDCETQI